MTEPVYQRRIDKHQVESIHLQERRAIKVYVPPDYTDRRAYPVLYLQDGEDYFRFGRIATTANRLIRERRIQPLLIAGIPVERARRLAEYSPAGARFRQYQLFLLNEIIPYMDRVYATIPAARGRVIGGSSLGATQALMTAIQSPHTFRAVLSQSGAFHPEMHAWLRQNGRNAPLDVYQTVGIHEAPAETPGGRLNILEWNRQVAQILRECGIKVCFQVKEGGHDWGFWQKDLPDALAYLFPMAEV
ncbi:MAG: hypothetical protein BAA01_04470 [Bacillus thermozeamaize]|uniref:Enterochelin esterase n=1 Tax=Bacillus thermozeamaize TaxID=230954 RepID=A0A1Y3PAD4_9BACI|nr:MAG: hypothetical protein BAA01_04470 [Bacillus thermozeamaize]